MDNRNLASAASRNEENSHLITVPLSLRPSEDSQRPMERASKAGIIVENIGSLAAAYDQPLSPDGIEVYTRALIDLSAEELQHGFNRAICELKFWPRPSELRELCMGHAASMTDKLRIDAAWHWVQWFIRTFGIPAKDRWEIQGNRFNGKSPEVAVRSSRSSHTLATTAPFYEIMVTAVPHIPELVGKTLTGMSGTVEMGLMRIREAVRICTGADGVSSKDSAFVRKDWDEYCARELATLGKPASSRNNPRLQLTGDVASEFPMPPTRSIAVRIATGREGYTFRRLNRKELDRLYDEGTLPQHLHEEGVRYHLRLEAEERFLDTPQEFTAVYLDIFRPLQQCSDQEPRRMGRFTIESSDGSRIICESLQMSIGDMELVKGQAIRFTAKPNDLHYEDFQRLYFDLQTMTVHQEASDSNSPITSTKDRQ